MSARLCVRCAHLPGDLRHPVTHQPGNLDGGVFFDINAARASLLGAGVPGVGVNPDPSEAVGFFLNRPQPNPARNATLIGFGLGRSDRVALRIYDISGRMVRELASGTRQPGIYDEAWNLRSDAGARVPAGIYFSRFESASFSAMRKVVVLH